VSSIYIWHFISNLCKYLFEIILYLRDCLYRSLCRNIFWKLYLFVRMCVYPIMYVKYVHISNFIVSLITLFLLCVFLYIEKYLNYPFIWIFIEITPFSTQILNIIRIKKKESETFSNR